MGSDSWRVGVAALALLACAASAKSASGRYSQRLGLCGMQSTPARQAQCRADADRSFSVEAHEESMQAQEDAAQAQRVAEVRRERAAAERAEKPRCERVAAQLRRCNIIDWSGTPQFVRRCSRSLASQDAEYPQMLCLTEANGCMQVKDCRRHW